MEDIVTTLLKAEARLQLEIASCASREKSIALTHLQTALLWLQKESK